MPRYDPMLDKEVPTDLEKHISNNVRQIETELLFIRNSVSETGNQQISELSLINAQLGNIQGRLAAISSSASLRNFLLFGILVVCISVANQIAPEWWHTPWWP